MNRPPKEDTHMIARLLDRPLHACLCIALLGALGVVGCQNDSGGGMTASADRSQRASARMESTARPSGIPAGARLMGQGGARLQFTAPSDGTLYVYDATAG